MQLHGGSDDERCGVDLKRRRLLEGLGALAIAVPALASKTLTPVRERPQWAPDPGEIVSISRPAGYFGKNGGATLAEISPAHQEWNPFRPSLKLYNAGQGAYGWHTFYGYCGSSFNTDTRQIVLYGTGHASINVCAPYCFDLNELRWKWLDRPLPFDAFRLIWEAGIPQPPSRTLMESYYPPEQHDYDWGDLNGDWPGWPKGFGRPGMIQPVPGHTRATMVHIPAHVMGNTRGALLYSCNHTGVLAGTNATGTHIFDYDTATWSRANNRLARYGSGRIIDPLSGKIIGFGKASSPSNEYFIFDIKTRTWSTQRAMMATSTAVDHGGNVFHTTARLHIAPQNILADGSTPSNGAGVKYRFYATPVDEIIGGRPFAPRLLTVVENGGWPLRSTGDNQYIGWSYCPADGCLYAINGEHGSNKYWRLAPPLGAAEQEDYLRGAWTLTEHVFAAGTVLSPGGRPRSMMYNRMQWDGVSNAFIFWVDSVDGPVQAWRPSTI